MPKVEAAKRNLLKISPLSEIQTFHMKVPMPGHFVTPNQLENVYADLLKLEEYAGNKHEQKIKVEQTEFKYSHPKIKIIDNMELRNH